MISHIRAWSRDFPWRFGGHLKSLSIGVDDQLSLTTYATCTIYTAFTYIVNTSWWSVKSDKWFHSPQRADDQLGVKQLVMSSQPSHTCCQQKLMMT